MAEKIFISYSRADKKRVFALKKEIEEHVGKGFCWLDISGIESDQEFVDVIINAINRADVFLFVYSGASKDSKWTRRELQFADRKHKRIVFVCIDNTPLSEWFEFNYGGHDIVDISIKEQKQKLLNNLVSWCKADCEASDSVVTPPAPEKLTNLRKSHRKIYRLLAGIIGGILLIASMAYVFWLKNREEYKDMMYSQQEEIEAAKDYYLSVMTDHDFERIKSFLDSYVDSDENREILHSYILTYNESLDEVKTQQGIEEYSRREKELNTLFANFMDQRWDKFVQVYNKGLYLQNVATNKLINHLKLLDAIREGIGEKAYIEHNAKIKSSGLLSLLPQGYLL